MYRHPLEIRIVFPAFEPFGRVLLVLGRDVPRHARYPALFLLRALQNYLDAVAFSFLCHCSVDDLVEVLGSLGLLEGGCQSLFVNSLDSGGGYFQGNPAAFLLQPETLRLQIGIESAFGTPYRVGNVVSGNGGFSGDFASFHSVVLISLSPVSQ